jgi:hypothetical protein
VVSFILLTPLKGRENCAHVEPTCEAEGSLDSTLGGLLSREARRHLKSPYFTNVLF